ncbi:MAG: YerC/YecD family TrpR-related protein [Clostridia bacterium]
MDLYEIFSRLDSKEEVEKLFADLCTIQEIEKMQQRLDSAVLLLNNETYNQIIEETDISSATLSRVSRCLKYGSGGYSEVLKGILKQEKK